MGQSQDEAVVNATDARRELFALVRRAERDGLTTLIHRHGERVVLAPLDRLPAARKADAFPSHALSAAQRDFGELLTLAAQGQPQVLRRSSTPIAVLLPIDATWGVLSSETAVPRGAVPVGGAVTRSSDQGGGSGGVVPRRLASLGDAIGAVLAAGPETGPTFGLSGLDAATGGLQSGRLTLVAAAPNVGGSLLGLAAARRTALVDNRRVLYAASGPNQADIMRRIISAETGGDYPRLKQGRLTPDEQQVARELAHVPLMIDDGSELTAEAIAETAPYVEDLALVVVDRLQAAHNARLPLSGDRLPNASQQLAGLARALRVPVLAIVDSADPALLKLLDADVLLTLAPADDPGIVQVTIAERDFGVIGTACLTPDLLHARFLDTPAATHAASAGSAGGEEPARGSGSAVIGSWPKRPFLTLLAPDRGCRLPSPMNWPRCAARWPAATGRPSTNSQRPWPRRPPHYRGCRTLPRDSVLPRPCAPTPWPPAGPHLPSTPRPAGPQCPVIREQSLNVKPTLRLRWRWRWSFSREMSRMSRKAPRSPR